MLIKEYIYTVISVFVGLLDMLNFFLINLHKSVCKCVSYFATLFYSFVSTSNDISFRQDSNNNYTCADCTCIGIQKQTFSRCESQESEIADF